MSSSTPGALNGSPSALDLRDEQVRSTTFTLKDQYGQPMPAGTTVSCSTNVGALQSPSSFTVPDTTSTSGYVFSCAVKGTVTPSAGQTCTATTGTLRVEVKTPRGLSTFFSTVSVTDNAKCTSPATITIAPATLPDGTLNTTYAAQIFTATGGTAPYSWSASGVPAGMTLAPTTGLLSVTPTATGAFAITINATDSGGRTGSVVRLLNVVP